MHKKLIFVTTLALSLSQGALAYEKQEYVSAESTERTNSLSNIELSEPQRAPKKYLESPPKQVDLSSSYFGVGYLSMSDGGESTGFAFNAGTSIHGIDFKVGFNKTSEATISSTKKHSDELQQYRANILLPLAELENFEFKAGLGYIHTILNTLDRTNDAFLGSILFKTRVSDSLIAHAGADFEFSSDDIIIDKKEYDVHSDATYKVGLDYIAMENLSIGASMSFGSELDESVLINVNYLF